MRSSFQHFILTACIFLIAFTLVGCASSQPTQEKPSSSTTPTVQLSSQTSTPTTEATPEPVPSVTELTGPAAWIWPEYSIRVNLDVSRYHAEVTEELVYTNQTGVALNELVLMVEPHRYPGVFHLDNLSVDGRPVINYSLTDQDNRLAIPLEPAQNPGEQRTVQIDYQLFLPKIPEPTDQRRPELFGYTSLQLNLVDWYVHIPVFDGEWLAHPAGYYGEHQVYEAANFDIELTVSDPAWIVAASASPQSVREGQYHFVIGPARNFAISLSPYYTRQIKQVQGVTIESYSLPFAGAGAEAVLEYTAQAVETYNRWFGPYPHKNLAVVQADFLDGMEFDGLFFLSKGFYNLFDGTPASYLGAIAVHETAHQWWYAQAGNDQALEPWLDEALSTFSEALYFEEQYPEGLSWWRQVRVDYYHPQGPINLPVNSYSGFTPYRNAVYLRGALFLLELRDLMGPSAFRQALQQLIITNQYQGTIDTAEFLSAMQAATTEDILPVVNRYFQTSLVE